MWLITQIGFFSIVDKQDSWEDHLLTIRARCRSDLLALRALYLPESSPIEHTPDNDYAFRIRAPRELVAKAAAALVDDITYPNFKQRVSERQGGLRAKHYHGVWNELYQLQRYPEDSEWLDRDWWSFPCGGPIPDQDEPVTVLEVGFEGGSVKLMGSLHGAEWRFWMANQEKSFEFIDEKSDGKSARSITQIANGWIEATTLLDAYPWKMGYPLVIHPWFAKRILLLREEHAFTDKF